MTLPKRVILVKQNKKRFEQSFSKTTKFMIDLPNSFLHSISNDYVRYGYSRSDWISAILITTINEYPYIKQKIIEEIIKEARKKAE